MQLHEWDVLQITITSNLKFEMIKLSDTLYNNHLIAQVFRIKAFRRLIKINFQLLSSNLF